MGSKTADHERALMRSTSVDDARKAFSAAAADFGYAWFDAVAMTASLMATPRRAGRFFVSNYLTGDPWGYLPPDWPADDEVAIQSSRMSMPIDYLKALGDSSRTVSNLYQRGTLKLYGVRKAWLFPHNIVGEYRLVTCYVTEKRADQEEHFLTTRDDLFLLSAVLVDQLDMLCVREEAAKPTPFVIGKLPVELTLEEQACLSWLTNGASNPQIAEELGLSVNTVKFHLKKVFRKLNVKTRAEAVAVAIDHGVGGPGANR